MFGDVVLGIPHEAYEAKLAALKKRVGIENDIDFSEENLEELCDMYYTVYDDYNKEFPQDAYEQVRACIKAVFGSWNSERAIKYREIHGITNLLGTACNIQTMVFGNLGPTSGTGVAFSRDPGTGHKELKGEYLVNAQGEDVVAGIRTPEHIETMAKALPEAYKQFVKNVDKLEHHFKDMQDVEYVSTSPVIVTTRFLILSGGNLLTNGVCFWVYIGSRSKTLSFGCYNADLANALDTLRLRLR